MNVRFDEAGRHEFAVKIYYFGTCPKSRLNGKNLSVSNANVGQPGGGAHQPCVFQDQVHGAILSETSLEIDAAGFLMPLAVDGKSLLRKLGQAYGGNELPLIQRPG